MKSKHIFKLDDVNPSTVCEKYSIETKNKTMLKDIKIEMSTYKNISFLDESRKEHKCITSMIDFESNKNVLDLKYNCFWCRHPFDTKGIGCPIRYVSNKIQSSYKSFVSKGHVVIKEDITEKQGENILKTDKNTALVKNNYYETDGIFCSFNCCKSWIKENKNNIKYRNSMILLLKMYEDLVGEEITVLKPAPHWRMLSEYGGQIDIDDFRSDFSKIEYVYHGAVKADIIFRPIGKIYEKNIKFEYF